jgi:hypothetical protein
LNEISLPAIFGILHKNRGLFLFDVSIEKNTKLMYNIVK